MKKPEYIEGEHALRNFQNGMKALFQASKQYHVQKKTARKNKTTSNRKRDEGDNGKV